MNKRLMLWVVSILIFQVLAYGYVEKVVLSPASDFSQETLASENDGKIDYSPDSDNYARITQDNVKIYSSGEHVIAEYTIGKKQTLDYFGWIPEKDWAVVGISEIVSPKSQLLIDTIGMGWFHQKNEYKLTGLPSGAKMIDAAYFSNKKLLNVLISTGGTTVLYRGNDQNKFTVVDLKTSSIRRIASLKNTDSLVFDSYGKEKVYIEDGMGSIKELPLETGSYGLIGVDRGSKIYIARMIDKNRATEILAGYAGGTFSVIKTLSSPYPLKSLKIDFQGNLIMN